MILEKMIEKPLATQNTKFKSHFYISWKMSNFALVINLIFLEI